MPGKKGPEPFSKENSAAYNHALRRIRTHNPIVYTLNTVFIALFLWQENYEF
jgi:hypothetical protein